MTQPSDPAPSPDAPQTDVYADDRRLYEAARQFFRAELRTALTADPTNGPERRGVFGDGYVAARAVKALAALADIMPPPPPAAGVTLTNSEYEFVGRVRYEATEVVKAARDLDPEFFHGRYETLGLAITALADLLDLEGPTA